MGRSAGRNPGNRLASLENFASLHPGYRNCAQAGFGSDNCLGPGEEEALATLDRYRDPFPDFVAHLRRLAGGQLPPIRASLPAELRQILEPPAEAIANAGPG